MIVWSSLLSIAILVWIFFAPAGRWDWPSGWLTLAVMCASGVISVVWLHRHNPELLRRRSKFGANTEKWDYALVANLVLGMSAQIVLGALDRGRSGAGPSLLAAGPGLLAYLGGCFLLGRSLRVNPFFESSVRLQSDRNQQVIREGVYAWVRHPGYAGMLFLTLGISGLLGSAWSLGGVPLVMTLLAARAILEEDFLSENLEGYADYRRQVRWRMFPGLW